MEFIAYYPMLSHDQSTPRATAHGRIGGPAVRSSAVVCARHGAGSRHAEARSQPADRPSLVSPLAPAGAGGFEGGGAAGPEAAARRSTVGAGRGRVAPGAAAPRVPYRSVDTAPRGDGHRAPDGRALSRRPRLVHP